MRITRAAKVAAFPLLALVLVVALIACQGPIGPKGDTGGKGDPGPQGTTGGAGPEGSSPVAAVDPSKSRLIFVNDGEVDNEIVVGKPEASYDLTTHFLGGYGTLEYSIIERATMGPWSTSTFNPTVTKEGVLTLEHRMAAGVPVRPKPGEFDYDPTHTNYSGESATGFMVEAVDKVSGKKVGSAMKRVVVIANRKPVAVAASDKALTFTVGAQDAEDAHRTGNAVADHDAVISAVKCTQFNVCEFNLEAVDLRTTSDAHFADDASSELTYSVVANSSKASATISGKKVTVTGLAPTWDKDKARHVPGIIKIRATDDGDLFVERGLSVTVDSAPMIEAKVQPEYSREMSEMPTTIISDIGVFFKDYEVDAAVDDNVNLVYGVAVTDGKELVTLSNVTMGILDTGQTSITVTARNEGTATIKVTAYDTWGDNPSTGKAQSVSQTFKIKVTKPAP